MQCLLQNLINIIIISIVYSIGEKIIKINKSETFDNYFIGFIMGVLVVIICASITVSISI
ncbi:hypothetical protein [Clostridium botulinum]|uniref:hypothetical protein n=1 Tax=Clostridium botulinum TaxID=1491 RepID=UPI001748043C|nr:hypothetical protein [Clostridium botulinum]MBD5589233.1 hypothetical protein [Clostridium botulinum]MBY6842714.1 hypothetical protein [Clostridium botulinum]